MVEESKLHNPTMRVLDILESVGRSKEGLTLTQISEKTNISKGTLHPIVSTLVERSYLEVDRGVYIVGRNCFKLGYTYVNSFDYLSILRPHMHAIVTDCDEICQLGILDGMDVLYLEKTEPNQAIRIESSAGKTLRAYATALGKCMLSEKSDREIRELYVTEELEPYTPYTVGDVDELIAQLQFVRDHGFFHEIGETNADVECIGVPIYQGNHILCAVSVSLPRFRATESKIEEIVLLLKREAMKVEQEIRLLPRSRW